MPGIKAFCVHSHFYQPPREDPFTGEVPLEPGAAPYHDWNERIYAECYLPNADAGNFSRISFDIGPTLFKWMDNHHPGTVQQIIAQDRENVERFGVGNAMGQAFNHSILPLASRRDKETQILWGIADFIHRFGRKPRGMWLPEAAVDQETLEVLVDCGIEYTILAPWQAHRIPSGSSGPFLAHLGEGRKISVFFYNQDLSTRVSFDPRSTVNADSFVTDLVMPKYHQGPADGEAPELFMVASDGELYGHHQQFREKFLAYLLNGALRSREVTPMFPELWMKEYPARQGVVVRDHTSWSCHHGTTRWMGDCACTSHNAWKAPLRQSLDQLAGEVDRVYEQFLSRWIPDPWALRNAYVHVFLGEVSSADLFSETAGKKLTPDEIWRIGLLLEAQRERQRMFTSCGWFFEDFNRIEPKNNIAYAARAAWLVRQAAGVNLAPAAQVSLRRVRSHRTGLTAAQVFAACTA
ncbi:MAG TPA: DUF3536 domain-containing protein, partial [Anaerolineaceae bacterium]